MAWGRIKLSVQWQGWLYPHSEYIAKHRAEREESSDKDAAGAPP